MKVWRTGGSAMILQSSSSQVLSMMVRCRVSVGVEVVQWSFSQNSPLILKYQVVPGIDVSVRVGSQVLSGLCCLQPTTVSAYHKTARLLTSADRVTILNVASSLFTVTMLLSVRIVWVLVSMWECETTSDLVIFPINSQLLTPMINIL